MIQRKTLMACGVACGLMWASWSQRPTSAQQGNGAADFSFRHYLLSGEAGADRKVRPVHPSYRGMESWISAVGAAVALNDIDGDGLPNDVCLVDTRDDSVTVRPAPDTGTRYRPFPLVPPGQHSQSVAPMGCLPGDFDEDGRMDILVYYWGRTPVLFLNRSSKGEALSAASFIPHEIVPGGGRWFSNAAIIADLNGDGHPDILIGNYFPDGEKVLDTSDSQPQHLHSSMSHAFNGGGKHFLLRDAASGGDGLVFVDTAPRLLGKDNNELSSNATRNALHGWTLAMGAADLNDDLLPEVYVANDFGPDRLFENMSTPRQLAFRLLTGNRGIATPKSKVLGNDSFKGMGVDFSDIQPNGELAILVSNITDEFALEESNFVFVNNCGALTDSAGFACYTDRSEELGLSRSGWAWDIKSGDFDNSGVPQVLQATGFLQGKAASKGVNRWPQLHETAMGNDLFLQYPWAWHNYHSSDDLSAHDINHFYVRQSNGRYLDLSVSLGILHHSPARGIAIADVYGDGRLDMAIANQWGPSDFYRNEARKGNSLSLRLLLPVVGPAGFAVTDKPLVGHMTYAMTAQVKIRFPDGHIMTQQVNGGNGHSGKNAFDLHFGLGNYSGSLPVQVRWRDRDGVVRSHGFSVLPGKYNVVLGA